jgi:hypothetical protein
MIASIPRNIEEALDHQRAQLAWAGVLVAALTLLIALVG